MSLLVRIDQAPASYDSDLLQELSTESDMLALGESVLAMVTAGLLELSNDNVLYVTQRGKEVINRPASTSS